MTGAAALMRTGRKRKSNVKREANGRAARAYVSPTQQVASQPHRRGVLEKYRELPEAESEFGRLMLRGMITPAQYEAGKQYAELTAKYRAVFDIPPANPTGIDLLRTGGGSAEMPTHVARAIRTAYDAAFEKCGEAGNRAQRAVKDFAVLERKISDFDGLKLLKDGLDKLVSHFGIDANLQIRHRQ